MEDNPGLKIIRALRKDYKVAEDWVLFYDDHKKEYYTDSGYLHDGTQQAAGFGRSGTKNSYTEYRIIQLSVLDNNEKWLLAVEMTELTLSPRKITFLEARRNVAAKKCKTNWILSTQNKYAEEMAKKYGKSTELFWLSEKTVVSWWKEIVGTVRLIALKKNCIF